MHGDNGAEQNVVIGESHACMMLCGAPRAAAVTNLFTIFHMCERVSFF